MESGALIGLISFDIFLSAHSTGADPEFFDRGGGRTRKA